MSSAGEAGPPPCYSSASMCPAPGAPQPLPARPAGTGRAPAAARSGDVGSRFPGWRGWERPRRGEQKAEGGGRGSERRRRGGSGQRGRRGGRQPRPLRTLLREPGGNRVGSRGDGRAAGDEAGEPREGKGTDRGSGARPSGTFQEAASGGHAGNNPGGHGGGPGTRERKGNRPDRLGGRGGRRRGTRRVGTRVGQGGLRGRGDHLLLLQVA